MYVTTCYITAFIDCPAGQLKPKSSFHHISFNEMFKRLNEMWKKIICDSEESEEYEFSEDAPKTAHN